MRGGGSGRDRSPGGSARRQGRPLAVRVAAALAAALAGGIALAACSSGTVAQWVGSSGLAANDGQLVIDIGQLETGIRLHELLPVRTACEAFSADAATADGQLPTPDHPLTDQLDSAYQDFYRAGVACYAAHSFTDSHFARFRDELAAGQRQLAAAERLVGRLTGNPKAGAPSPLGASG